MQKNLWLIGIAVLVLVAVGLFLYNQQRKGALPVPVSEPVEQSIPVTKEITVEGDEFKFSPDKITLAKGEKIRVTFKNTGEQPHNLIIDELGVATKTIAGGEEDVVVFGAKETGEYTFYCGVANHRDLGMEGSVEVQSSPASSSEAGRAK